MVSPLDTLFTGRCEGERSVSLDFLPAMVEEGCASTLERTDRMAVLPRLRVPVSLVRLRLPVSLVRLRVPEPPATCFIITAESLVRFPVPPSRGVAFIVLSLVSGRSGDLTREMDNLEMGWALGRSLDDNFFFVLALAATEDLPFVDLFRVDFAGDLTSNSDTFFLDSTLASLRASLVLSEEAAAACCEAVTAEFHFLEGGRGGRADV